jgi:pyruvate kinase
MRKTKIVCTLGPATESYEVLNRLAAEGMDVARLNFSHGTHEYHAATIDRLKRLRAETGRNIGILQDLRGPKIRTGDLPADGICLKKGDRMRLVVDDGSLHPPVDGTGSETADHTVPVSYPGLVDDIDRGERILFDDGLLGAEVVEKDTGGLVCEVLYGGILLSHKGVNFPDSRLSVKAPTEKDLEDLEFGLRHEVDFVALSFVENGDDIRRLRKAMEGAANPPLIVAKIERVAALGAIDEIIEAADAVMVARGDLGVEAEMSMVPLHQKAIIRACNTVGKPVITATQMLNSMIDNPLPTRAEVTDVANAVFDGCDAVMLSGETAVGAYPLDSVAMMRRIIENVENDTTPKRARPEYDQNPENDIEEAVASAACRAARELDASYIVAQSISGRTAIMVSRFRPEVPILAITPLKSTHHRLSLVWGIRSVLVTSFEDAFIKTIRKTDEALVTAGLARNGDLVVVTAGIPAGGSGGTNVMKIHKIGDG